MTMMLLLLLLYFFWSPDLDLAGHTQNKVLLRTS